MGASFRFKTTKSLLLIHNLHLILGTIHLRRRQIFVIFDHRHSSKMSPPPFRKNAIKMGLIFLVGRMALCILFAIMSATTDQTGYRSKKALLIIQLFAPIAILFAIGAISDLVLVFGAWKKNVAAIYVWCGAQFFVGGLVCCIAIPLVALKAVQEIKYEEEGLPTTQAQNKV